MKLCECGCGQPSPIAKKTEPNRGRVKGQPFRYRQGHALRGRSGSQSNSWTGGRVGDGNGYMLIAAPTHPRAVRGYVLEHILIAEKALGRFIPESIEIHHFNEVRSDNRGGNLVICEDRDYHCLLHVRTRAYRACGDPSSRKCKYCKKWDREAAKHGYHIPCKSLYDKQRSVRHEIHKN